MPTLVLECVPHIQPHFLINILPTNNSSNFTIKAYSFFNSKYYFDIIYNHFLVNKGLQLGYKISKEIDRGTIELFGPFGLSNNFYKTGLNIAKLDTGIITTYSLYITIKLN